MANIDLDLACINTLRFLAADAVEKAQSGHAGTPMGAAPLVYILWSNFLKHSPSHPDWVDRDRFVLSSGHASMLLYAILHLTGYKISLKELKKFRQWGSLTPGHPEYRHTPGIEITTGPLGQGFANAVGMAMAEAHLSAKYNKPNIKIIDHFTYVMVSDGDLMEGVSAEAASLAGHLQLGKLICLYDNNHVTIEGSTDLTFTENTADRFKAYGWHVQKVEDINNLHGIEFAINAAREETDQPSLVIVKSIIGYGSPSKQGTSAAHSGPLGSEDLNDAKRNLDWLYKESFFVPDEVRRHLRKAVKEGNTHVKEWVNRFEAFQSLYPAEAKEFKRIMEGGLPPCWENCLPVFRPETGNTATRKANAPIINSLSSVIPELMGGSADLAPSNITLIENAENFSATSYQGRVIRFGIREHAMGALLNGLSVHGGILPFGATFFTFSDYLRPAIRLAALMKLPVIYIFTHDSISVGEDGPTHQPVEQLISLRSVPNLTLIRPCDANETSEAWRMALQNYEGPTCLVLSRQDIPILDRRKFASAKELEKGAYILSEERGGNLDLILIGTGSEVHLALEAQLQLIEKGYQVRVVSMPSWELFSAQSKSYQDSVLPPTVTDRISIEAGSPLGWERWVGDQGKIIGLNQFGASAPANELNQAFGFTVENVVKTALELMSK
jgi:transketolase